METEILSHVVLHASKQFLEVRHLCPMAQPSPILLNKDDFPQYSKYQWQIGMMWSFWQAPTFDSHMMSFGYWIKALPSSSDNNFPFGKEVLAC